MWEFFIKNWFVNENMIIENFVTENAIPINGQIGLLQTMLQILQKR